MSIVLNKKRKERKIVTIQTWTLNIKLAQDVAPIFGADIVKKNTEKQTHSEIKIFKLEKYFDNHISTQHDENRIKLMIVFKIGKNNKLFINANDKQTPRNVHNAALFTYAVPLFLYYLQHARISMSKMYCSWSVK